MLYLKSFHIIFLVAWFGGLFYLPRLFVYHTEIEPTDPNYQRFCTMERKLFWGIMTPCAILALIMGLGLLHYWWGAIQDKGWMHAKLLLVGFLICYHYQCYRYLKAFKEKRNT
ncbi:MAG TPA: CopD family protein, partial [Gammaproteobacteria bacterium]|nr:CopD family protein [Gammaproteobacteria bacterium]